MQHASMAFESIHESSLAPTTKHLATTCLRHMLRNLVSAGAPYGLVDSLPRIPRPDPRPDTVTDFDLSVLLDCAPHLQLFILLCHDCALRSGTAAQVAWPHISGDRSLLVIRTKRFTVTRVPISGRINELLEQCPAGAGPLTSLLAGHHLGVKQLRKQFRDKLREANLPLTTRPHDLRRTMAEKTYNLTSDLRVVQTLLGHSSLNSTVHYIQRPAQTHMDALAASIETITASHERFPE